MGWRARSASIATLLAVLVLAGAATALARAATSITLEAERPVVEYGRGTLLSGEVTPAAAGQPVSIVDVETAEVLRTTVTDADGSYATTLQPDRSVRVQATSGTATSEVVAIGVRPVLSATLGTLRLFDRGRVTGRLEPAHAGQRVRVVVSSGGDTVERRWARLRDAGTFVARFPVDRAGRYRAEVRFRDADHAPVAERTGVRRVATPPNLHVGSSGRYVKVLESRLRQLDYYLPGANRRYDAKTGDAVIAFHKVQGMSRSSSVGAATWRRLADPREPRPRSRRPRHHIEIDQTKQVLYVVDRGKITAILHTSTGKSSTPTYDGVFRVHRKLAGYSPNNLYMPSYFDGNRAVHGWPSVPTYPASHGCSRVPMWAARWIYRLMPLGTQVRVYHS